MLEIDDLSKRYGEVVALDGCSFTVEPGRMLGFLGPNGAGKTTAMRAIFGLVRPDAGEVRWHGERVAPEHRLRFGYMPEQRGLYPRMKTAEQLTYFGQLHGMSAADARAATDRWLEDLGLADRADDPVENLSHGNQQRVQLAAALVHDPELAVLDEPFNGLDPLGVDTMAEVLAKRAAEGTAVVFSSHQLDLVEDLCEDVAIIHQGRVVVSGLVRSLQDDSPHRVLEVELAGDGHQVLERLDGVVRSTFDGHRHRLVVSADTEIRSLLRELELGAEVRHFSYSTLSLSDLFKEAVA